MARILHEATLSLFAVPNTVRAAWGARVAYVVSPALSYAFTSLLIARIMGVRCVLVVKDIMPDVAVELGMLRNRFIIAISRQLARWAYAMADEIHTLVDGMVRRIALQAGGHKKIRIVPDTIDAQELCPVPMEQNEFRRQFVPQGTFAVLHTGNMGRKQDLDVLLRAAERLRDDPTVQFYVFGDGAERARFIERRSAMELRNVSHYPLQDREMLRHMLSGADVVVVSQLAEVVDIVVPSKLLTAMASGALIVAACSPNSETACLVRESDGGIVIAAGDDVALVDTIKQVRSGKLDGRSFRQHTRRYAVERFDRETVYGEILGHLQNGIGVTVAGGRVGRLRRRRLESVAERGAEQ